MPPATATPSVTRSSPPPPVSPFARLEAANREGDWNDVLRNTKPIKGACLTVSDSTQFEPLNRLKDEMGLPRDHYGAFPQTSHKPRAWILLKSGRRLDLLDPEPDAWTDEDLAIGLSRTYRWAGYSKWDLPLSVAQHSLAVLALREGERAAHRARGFARNSS